MNKQRLFVCMSLMTVIVCGTVQFAEPADMIWREFKSKSMGSLISSEDFPTMVHLARSRGPYPMGIGPEAVYADIALDDKDERPHHYSKDLLYQQGNGGIQANRPDVFFEEPDSIAFEIRSIFVPGTGEMSYLKVGHQEALKDCRMKVLYKGLPLADAKVSISVESGWRKILRTDSRGEFIITPIETSRNSESYLYAVSHRDPISGVRYASSLVTLVIKPQPEWMKKAGRFILWIFTGMGIVTFYIIGALYRKRKLGRKVMLEFERHKIGRD